MEPSCDQCGKRTRGNFVNCSRCFKVLCDNCDIRRDDQEEPLCEYCKNIRAKFHDSFAGKTKSNIDKDFRKAYIGSDSKKEKETVNSFPIVFVLFLFIVFYCLC